MLLRQRRNGRNNLPKQRFVLNVKGARLNKEALHFRIHDKNINELANMDINELYDWLMKVDEFLSDKQKKIISGDY